VGVALILLCSLAFVASSAEAAGHEVWLVRQRVRWITNSGTSGGTFTYEGEMQVTVSSGKALDFSIVSNGWNWTGDFVADAQVWRDTTVKNHYLVFRAVDLSGSEIAGYFRPNAKWTKLNGKFTGTWKSLAPSESWYCEGTVTATYDHTDP
jgi:hypothetical protein